MNFIDLSILDFSENKENPNQEIRLLHHENPLRASRSMPRLARHIQL